jgi:hypothetical protein
MGSADVFYNMAKWTELKDFRDDCRSVQASGGPFSLACEQALGKELEPPPYTTTTHYSRLAKRGLHTAKQIEISRLVQFWITAIAQSMLRVSTVAWTISSGC